MQTAAERRCGQGLAAWTVMQRRQPKLVTSGVAMTETMKAIVLHAPGGPDALRIEERRIPTLQPGTAILRIAAFGLNRSELFTRQGHSPGVSFPRILGIEAVGEILQADGGFMPGDPVATVMGGMGRDFDGGYAEYARIPVTQIRKISTDLPWSMLGAMPEMLQTAWGALFSALGLQAGERLLVRGGTTSVGLAATALARDAGAVVSQPPVARLPGT